MNETETKKINWTRLAVTSGLVLLTALAVGGTTWYVMDKNAKDEKAANDKSVAELQKTVDELNKKTAKTTTTTLTTEDWKIYKNLKYNFQLTFSDSWKGYTIKENTQSEVDASVRPVVSYEFYQTSPNTNEKVYFFSVNVYSLSKWQSIEDNGGGPNNVLLGKNGQFAFSASRRLDIDPAWGFSQSQSNVSQITDTFKLF